MRKTAIYLAVLILLRASAFGQSSGSGRKAAPNKISDDYAKAALFALKRIEREVPVNALPGSAAPRDDELLRDIDRADATATTDSETKMTATLTLLHLKAAFYNIKLISQAEVYESADPKLSHALALQRVAQEPEMQSLKRELDACFSDFDKTLRARSEVLPAACAFKDDKKQ
jgi:hypothetical protein